MKNSYIDLHIHSTFSDGTLTPEEIVRYASRIGLSAISITDHDNTDGIPSALEAGRKWGVEVIPGVELSVEPEFPGDEEIHILGYFVNWEYKKLRESLSYFRQARRKRVYQILEKLNHLGIRIEPEQVFAFAGGGSVGRVHVARTLKEEGFVDYPQEAFDLYLAYGKPAYVPKARLSSQGALNLISEANGISVIAHPLYGGNAKEVIEKLKNLGLDGIEVYYTKHAPEHVEKFLDWANVFSLLVTGGSDCHGGATNDGMLMGSLKIPYTFLENLKQYRAIKLAKKHRD